MSAEGMSHKVRRIAILVTSLDTSAGRQLLMAMPTDLARQVRRAMAQLTNIDPDEQRQILAEFRMQALISSDAPLAQASSAQVPDPTPAAAPVQTTNNSARSTQATEDTHSPYTATLRTGFTPADDPQRISAQPDHRPWQHLNIDSLSELLRGERATVVAVVLSQLESAPGAQVLSKLSKSLQREVIVSLSRLGQIDPDAMAAIDEHLASRIADYHHRKAGENESTSRMQGLLAAADPELRQDWQATLVQAEPQLASRMGLVPIPIASQIGATPATVDSTRSQSSSQSSPSVQAATQRAASNRNATNMLDLLRNSVVTTDDPGVASSLSASVRPTSTPASAHASAASSDSSPLEDSEEEAGARILPFPTKAAETSRRSMRFDEILDLPAEIIGEVLAAADTEVILYALAGASPAFMKRFTSMLDRADSRALQARLKALRAINLRDVDAAQQRLCELALERSGSKVAA